jgi:hypothetical protein
MRRILGWIAVLAMVGALAACEDSNQGASTGEAAVESTAAQTQIAPSTTAAVAVISPTTGVPAEVVESTTVDSVARTAGSSEEAATQPVAQSLEQLNVDGLLWMREEEKLARDVYTALSEMWDLPIFANIADSEQTHTDAVGALLDAYGIADPMADDVPGVFVDPTIQGLYDELVEQGSKSLVDALVVGATIEDMDIVDLRLRRSGIEAIDDVYANLEKGSRNHLRAFIRTLERQGGEYVPAYLTVAEYEAIISAPTERNPAGA